MTIQVLFGQRLYDNVLYSTNPSPQSLSTNLSDSTSLGESRIDSLNKVLPPQITLGAFPLYGSNDFSSVVYGFNGTGVYDGKIILLESIVHFLSTKALVESLSLSESRVLTIAQNLVESLSVTDSKAHIVLNPGLTDFVVLKEWLTIQLQKNNGIWSTLPTNTHAMTLFGQLLYSKPLYGFIPVITWTPSLVTVAENFTNADGKGNVP